MMNFKKVCLQLFGLLLTLMLWAFCNPAFAAKPLPPRHRQPAPTSANQLPQNNQMVNIDNSLFDYHGPAQFSARFSGIFGFVGSAKMAGSASTNDALAGELGFGPREFRANGTWAHGFRNNPKNRMKITVEHLSQNMDFDFSQSNTSARRWVHQQAAGGAFGHFFPEGRLISLEASGYYAFAHSKSLPTYDTANSMGPVRYYRRIAGATSAGGMVSMKTRLWRNAHGEFGFNYDNVHYRKHYESGGDRNGVGATVKLHQLLSKRVKANVFGSTRHLYDEFGLGLNWLVHARPGTSTELGVDFRQVHQKGLNEPTESRMGLSLTYLWGGSKRGKAREYSLTRSAGEDLLDYARDPVVHMAQVIVMTEERMQQGVTVPVCTSMPTTQNHPANTPFLLSLPPFCPNANTFVKQSGPLALKIVSVNGHASKAQAGGINVTPSGEVESTGMPDGVYNVMVKAEKTTWPQNQQDVPITFVIGSTNPMTCNIINPTWAQANQPFEIQNAGCTVPTNPTLAISNALGLAIDQQGTISGTIPSNAVDDAAIQVTATQTGFLPDIRQFAIYIEPEATNPYAPVSVPASQPFSISIGSGHFNAHGGPLAYTATLNGNPLSFSGSNITGTAPATPGPYTIELTATKYTPVGSKAVKQAIPLSVTAPLTTYEMGCPTSPCGGTGNCTATAYPQGGGTNRTEQFNNGVPGTFPTFDGGAVVGGKLRCTYSSNLGPATTTIDTQSSYTNATPTSCTHGQGTYCMTFQQ